MSKKQIPTALDRVYKGIEAEMGEKLRQLQNKYDNLIAWKTIIESMLKDMTMSEALHELTSIIFEEEICGSGKKLWDVYACRLDAEGEDGDGGEVIVSYEGYKEYIDMNTEDNFMEFISYVDYNNEEFKIGGLIMDDECQATMRHESFNNEVVKRYVPDGLHIYQTLFRDIYEHMTKSEKEEYTKICERDSNIYRSIYGAHT